MSPPGMRFPAVRDIPYMGVINVVAEASKLGFYNGHPDWTNMGQGQPEVGPMAGAPERLRVIELEPFDAAYGPVNGINELREAIAATYNRQYRRGMASQYTAENVAVASGGRLMLSRAFAILSNVPVAYQTPDYTAYEEMLDYHRYRFIPVHLAADAAGQFRISPARLADEIAAHGLGAFVVSNPCNPTGQVIAGPELKAYVDTCRKGNCLLVADEFYSHFIYTADGKPGAGPISAAAHVADVDTDPVLIIDGITKSHRYPGLRLGWAVGPRAVIDALGRAASAIDGGPSLASQRFALMALEPGRAEQETHALREVFAAKRALVRASLEELGVEFLRGNDATFYLWGNVAGFPAQINDGEKLFRAALAERVMVVPGEYFDINPGKARQGPSRLGNWVRFSFGPPEENLRPGLERLTSMVRRHRSAAR